MHTNQQKHTSAEEGDKNDWNITCKLAGDVLSLQLQLATFHTNTHLQKNQTDLQVHSLNTPISK